MAYYSGKKIFSIVKTVEEHPPVYEGEYTITENGTYNTGGKKMEGDLTVNVTKSGGEPVVEYEGVDFGVQFKGNLKSISLKETFKDAFPNLTSTAYMFAGSNHLTSIDLSNFDTSKVTSMSSMFSNCRVLTSLDLSSFDTSNVTNMSSMFSYCSSLTSLDLSSFDTSKVTDMGSMFYDCDKLTSLDLSSFDTSNVTNMSSMFYDCYKLASLNLSSFDTSKVTSMSYMFRECYKLTSLDLSSFDTSKVTGMNSMFYECDSLTSLRFPSNKSFNISSTGLVHDGLVVLLNDLKSVTTTQTLTMGSAKLALLSDAEKKIATDKGWTLA